MLSTERMVRVVVEIIFVLLGGLVIWLGVQHEIFFNRRIFTWPLLAVILLLWGLWALWKPRPGQLSSERWARGLSLSLLGLIMLVIWKAPFLCVSWLIAAAGGVLLLRGLIASYFLVRVR